MWLQHFFRASPQTVPSWRSWIGYRWKLLRWSTPWSKFFLVLEIELRDQNCPFHAVCGKILSQTADGMFERQNFFRRTSLKGPEPHSAFKTLHGKSCYVPPQSSNTAWSELRIFFVENSWYRYGAHIFSLENHQSALVKIDRKDFHNELVEKTVSGYPLKRLKNAPHEHMKKKGTIDAAIWAWYFSCKHGSSTPQIRVKVK